jgi:ribosomal protein L14E/L6E/L27E
LKVLNLGKYEEVPGQFKRWVYSGGKKVNGLVNRRENEIQLWNDNKVIERRRVEQIKNVAATLEWLMKRSPVKIQGVTFEGKEVFIKYDHSIQQFRMEE